MPCHAWNLIFWLYKLSGNNLPIKLKAVLKFERMSAWYESSTATCWYSKSVVKRWGQWEDTFKIAVTPSSLNRGKLAESFAHPRTRWGKISTGGPNKLLSSSWGVCSCIFCSQVVCRVWKEIGRLALTDTLTGELPEDCSQRLGNCDENEANPPNTEGREDEEWIKCSVYTESLYTGMPVPKKV